MGNEILQPAYIIGGFNMRDQQKEKAEIGFWMGVAFVLVGLLNM
jgi:hypothetical protein